MTPRDKLLADLRAQLDSKLAMFEALHVAGSIRVEIHLDSEGPRKVTVQSEEHFPVPRKTR